MYTIYELEKQYIELISYNYDQKASFLTDETDLWFSGGFEDMSTNIAWKWSYMKTSEESKDQ